MRAVILAAGTGRRLGPPHNAQPKVLLQFGGETLLARHLKILAHFGIGHIDICVGYRANDVTEEIGRIGAPVAVHYNPDFERGSIVSLVSTRTAFTAGDDVLFMDGDVLYDHRLLEPLIAGQLKNCFLIDRDLEPGEEPVKLCLRDGHLVDIHKTPTVRYEKAGEWIGFARFGPAVAAEIIAIGETVIAAGGQDQMYEEALHRAVASAPAGKFDVADVTGLPWIEIDFPEDLERAQREIFPRLSST